uniref:Putative conserved plasma membrane protein n=1 Tax=Corethrella appendiculata TaxID=1370023 RepID=U5ENS7_9DIPT
MSDDSEIKTYFKLVDIVKWLGLTQFEIFINFIGFFIFSIILAIKFALQQQTPITQSEWLIIFAPLFISDICNAYFCTIVGIRMYLSHKHKQAVHKCSWSTQFLVLTSIFKYLVYLKLSAQTGLEYSEVFSPIFVLLQLIAVKACQFKQQS